MAYCVRNPTQWRGPLAVTDLSELWVFTSSTSLQMMSLKWGGPKGMRGPALSIWRSPPSHESLRAGFSQPRVRMKLRTPSEEPRNTKLRPTAFEPWLQAIRSSNESFSPSTMLSETVESTTKTWFERSRSSTLRFIAAPRPWGSRSGWVPMRDVTPRRERLRMLAPWLEITARYFGVRTTMERTGTTAAFAAESTTAESRVESTLDPDSTRRGVAVSASPFFVAEESTTFSILGGSGMPSVLRTIECQASLVKKMKATVTATSVRIVLRSMFPFNMLVDGRPRKWFAAVRK